MPYQLIIPLPELTEAAIIAALSATLEAHGCTVTRDQKWETPLAFRERVGAKYKVRISPQHLQHRTEHRHCPTVKLQRGELERLIKIGVPCAEFERFVVENLRTAPESR